MADHISSYPVLKSFLAGSFSGTCSTLLFQPLDLIKTRLQSPFQTRTTGYGMVSLLCHVVKNEKVIGLWKGTVPSMTRCVPGVGLYFCSLNWLQRTLEKNDPSPIDAVCLGISARSLTGVILLPITVIKTRYESGVYSYVGVVQALRVIHTTEGFKGLFSGLIPTLLRDAPFSGIYLMFYTQTKKAVPESWRDGMTQIPTIFLCGTFSGLLASTCTQPADVIKTHMQLYPSRFTRVSIAVLYIYKEYGLAGYFKGLVPRVLRRTLMTALAWTVFEQVSRELGLK
ncbi:solute carrier family 25 member 38-like [Limulus polyphemus]|uniref:Mitochondrial glycine transporter n=1 Tax=Limulus polyphemus TaxID=6850 RepID=A0ABM1B1E7_LIMPO|nr:solute carrier family 25 member 38-like [Limulus polyphemus]XP_013772830.1 solute carrier family 25 member 38-like [Limulus polyphemus]